MLKADTEAQTARGMERLRGEIRAARREHKLSQSDLAREAGCRQSAISMFESGRAHVLSEEKLQVICDLLGIARERADDTPSDTPASHHPGGRRSLSYCPQSDCPSNIPYLVAGELYFLPAGEWADDSARHCRHCGERLEHNCPECGCAVNPGACCTGCGCGYVTGGPAPGEGLAEWVDSRRRTAMHLMEMGAGVRQAPAPHTTP